MTNWKDVHPDFTEEKTHEWIKWSFDKESCREWLEIGLLPHEAEYAQWLRDIIHETPQNISSYGEGDAKFLQKEFKDFISLYYSEEPEETDNNVSEESSAEERKTIQAQEWLDQEYPVDGKCKGNFDKGNKGKKRKKITTLNISKKELEGSLTFEGFNNLEKLIISTSYEELLDLEGNKNILHRGELTILDLRGASKLRELDCSDNLITKINLVNNKRLITLHCEGNSLHDLDVSNCPEIEELYCGSNKLKGLNLSNNTNLIKLYLGKNNLVSLDFLNQLPKPKKLTNLVIEENDFPLTNLAIFSKFTNLKELCLWGGNFKGSLKPLEELTKLEELNIDDTDIEGGLEYLPKSLKIFTCIRCSKVEELLEKEESDSLPTWKSEWKMRKKRKKLEIELLQWPN